jgi:hypothetical protein
MRMQIEREREDKESRRVEIERILTEGERMFSENGKNITIRAMEPPRVTVVRTTSGEAEKTPQE